MDWSDLEREAAKEDRERNFEDDYDDRNKNKKR